jgi:GDP-L-fucose synthase
VTKRRILLTGASGFFGSHIREALAGEVVCPGRRELDLLALDATTDYLATQGVTHVVHAAGFVGGIGLNQAHPGRMATENLRMGLNVLEAAATKGGVHVTIVSTICVYPEGAATPTCEDAMYEGYPSPVTAPYGLAKRALHSVADALAKEKRITYAYLVPTNLYGPGDHFDEAKSHVVPALLRRALEATRRGDHEIVVWGDGSATRDLLYAADAARGVAATLDRGHGLVINLGSGREVSIKELAETICRVVGFRGRLIWDRAKPQGAPRRALDASRAREVLGFRPEIELEEGLQRTLMWYTATTKHA